MKLTKRERRAIALGIPVEGVCPKCYNRLDITYEDVGPTEHSVLVKNSKCYGCGWEE